MYLIWLSLLYLASHSLFLYFYITTTNSVSVSVTSGKSTLNIYALNGCVAELHCTWNRSLTLFFQVKNFLNGRVQNIYESWLNFFLTSSYKNELLYHMYSSCLQLRLGQTPHTSWLRRRIWRYSFFEKIFRVTKYIEVSLTGPWERTTDYKTFFGTQEYSCCVIFQVSSYSGSVTSEDVTRQKGMTGHSSLVLAAGSIKQYQHGKWQHFCFWK